ncbi:MAG: transcriptional regulator, partial [Candidatus Moranbacteria bacterium]|nr:transcriptional regulator [Candidatus Moranbacteria bacterium]
MNKEIALLCKALSDENRLTILELLIRGETCGCTLIDKLPITQPTMSYHLRTLSDSGKVPGKEGIPSQPRPGGDHPAPRGAAGEQGPLRLYV